jgi:hypothetical protein
MVRNRRGYFSFAVGIVIVALLLAGTSMTQVRADDVSNRDDGRINQLPWVNSFGAIAVYCVDATNHPASSFTGGGIYILNAAGRQMFFAPEAIINPARITANRNRMNVLIHRETLYSLYALPDGYFQVNSIPDAEGKVFLGIWKDCDRVIPGTNAPPPPSEEGGEEGD